MEEPLTSYVSFSTSSTTENIQESDVERLPTPKKITIASSITKYLRDKIVENYSKDASPVIDCFYAKKIPSMSMEDYLNRIIKYSELQDSSLIISIIYIIKTCDRNNYILNFNNIHRILLTSVIVAIKYNEDDFYKNTQYSKIGGIPLDELNRLEYEFCSSLDFNLHVDVETYKECLSKLI
jgi:hypothetical protein